MVKYLEYITDQAGPVARMRMILQTGITEKLARLEPDTPEKVFRMRKAIADLIGVEAPVFELPGDGELREGS